MAARDVTTGRFGTPLGGRPARWDGGTQPETDFFLGGDPTALGASLLVWMGAPSCRALLQSSDDPCVARDRSALQQPFRAAFTTSRSSA